MEEEDILGVVHGKTKTSEFSFRIFDLKKIMQGQYVIAIEKDTKRKILGHITGLVFSGRTAIAHCEVLGEVRNSSLSAPKRPITAGSQVIMPTREFLENLLVKSLPEKRLLIGKIFTHPQFIPVFYNPEDLARHLFITATTGGGKSYAIGVFIEELISLMERFKEEYSIVVFDVHNEYGGLLLPNEDEEQIKKLEEYGLKPRAFCDNVFIFDWDYNPPKLSPVFTPDRLLFIYGMKEYRFALLLQQLVKNRELITLEELYSLVELSDLHPSTKQALLIRIRALIESGLLHDEYITPEKFLKPGWSTIFRLANTPLGDFGIRFFVADILRQIYDAYKEERVKHKTIIVIDEAHLFAQRGGQRDPVREIIERIAREGRKYGLWLIISSQSPRDLSDTILMQCNSILALKLHKEDASELSKVFGIPKDIADSLTVLPPGQGYLKAPSLRLPIMIEIRTKQSLDIKGLEDRQRRVEEEVKRRAYETKLLIFGPSTEIEKEVIKPEKPKEPKKVAVTTLLTSPKEEVQETKKDFATLVAPKKKIKEKIRRERVKYDREVLESIIEEIKDQGIAARALIRELIIYRQIPLPKALTLANERVIDALKIVGFIRERGNTLILNLGNILETRIGRRLSTIELEEYLNEIYEQI